MTPCRGNIWLMLGTTNLLLFTSNSTLNKAGHLVMGAGIAKETKENFPMFPKILGDKIKAIDKVGKWYGVLVSPNYEVGAFQTKTDWKLPSTLELIEYSTEMLIQIASNYERIDMPVPGCGNGGLNYKDVEPIIKRLPDNVHIWSRL